MAKEDFEFLGYKSEEEKWWHMWTTEMIEDRDDIASLLFHVWPMAIQIATGGKYAEIMSTNIQ